MTRRHPRRPSRSKRLLVALLFATSLTVGACSEDLYYGGGDFGATAGGVQDMGLARELIDQGIVPPPEAFVVEGMFSEHDLPLNGQPCTSLMCLRAAAGFAPTLDGTPSAWLQVGLSSNIDPATFQRKSQTLVMAIDSSGSMTSSYENVNEDGFTSPMEISRALLHAIVDELGPNDQVAIVTYGSRVKTVLGLTQADDERVRSAIDGIETDGVTRMEEGLRKAYEIARGAGGNNEKRVMLFTDMRPNVGATQPTDFEQIAGEGADAGIGLTCYGVGIGLGQEVMNAMSHLRGGNAFTLIYPEQVQELMDDSWPWMVSPIAYDMAVEIVAAEGFSIAEGFGFPGAHGQSAGFDVATVFLSKRRGGLLLRVDLPEQFELSDLSFDGTITHTPPGGSPVEDEIRTGIPGGSELDDRGHYYAQASVGRTVSLAILVSGMRQAVEHYAENESQEAIAIMEAVVARLTADAAALEDESLASEIPLAEALLALMVNGAEMSDPYYR